MSTITTPSAPYRDGDCIVVTEGATMPRRCPLCNGTDVADPIEVRMAVQRKGGLVGKAVSAGIDHLKGWNYTGPVSVAIPFCQRHRARRTYAIVAGLVLIAIGAAAVFFVVQAGTRGVTNIRAFAPLAIGVIVTASTLSGVLNLWFKPRRFEDRTVWLTGASEDYLRSLPTAAARPSAEATNLPPRRSTR